MNSKQRVEAVNKQLATIKDHMPAVYAAVQAKAGEIGNEAFALVRRGAKGEPDCFYAFEGGRVVGTPFGEAVAPDVAQLIVQFGATFLCMWPAVPGKRDDGTH
jgi:hypothetical protein